MKYYHRYKDVPNYIKDLLRKNRDNYLESSGYTILRINNNEIETNIDGVVAKISSNIKSL